MAIAMQPAPLSTIRQRRKSWGSYFRLGHAGLLAGAVAAVCVLSILYLAQTGHVATRGYQLQKLQAEEKTLLRQADTYQYRIAKMQVLDVIQERAQMLGMRPATPAQIRYAEIPLETSPFLAQR